MGLNDATRNGTIIADLCYKDDNGYRSIGSLIYFRSHDAEIKLDIIPAKAWSKEQTWFFGNFIMSDKVPDAPYVEGDIVVTTDTRGKHLKVGHVHTRDNEAGDAQYYMELFGIPVGQWSAMIAAKADGSKKRSMYMKIEMEDS